MKIENKGSYICKHIGWGLLLIGIIGLFTPFKEYIWILMVISIIFQVIGLKEPLWFEVDKEEYNHNITTEDRK